MQYEPVVVVQVWPVVEVQVTRPATAEQVPLLIEPVPPAGGGVGGGVPLFVIVVPGPPLFVVVVPGGPPLFVVVPGGLYELGAEWCVLPGGYPLLIWVMCEPRRL
jgi:hypothetical protein